MAITVTETHDSPITKRGLKPETVTRWKVRSDSALTRNAAYNALLLNTADVRDALLRNSMTLTPTESERVWLGEILYKVDPQPSSDAPLKFKGSTRGGRAKIERSLGTTAHWRHFERDFGNAIEVDDAGKIGGAETYLPNLEFSLEFFLSSDLFTYSYMRTLYQYTPSVNSRPFGPFIAGECLFLGVEWSPSQDEEGEELTQLTFHFLAGHHETIDIDGLKPSPIVKPPHDHLWFLWEETKDNTRAGAGAITKQITQANVEQLYPLRNFAALGIGL